MTINPGQMFGVRQGWQCPICKQVYSPDTPMCWYCGNNRGCETVYSTSTNPKEIKRPFVGDTPESLGQTTTDGR